MKTYPKGLVLNTESGAETHYLKLHRVGCHHISGYTSRQSEGGFTRNRYIKVCSTDLSAIQRWIARNRPATAVCKPCGTCKPPIPAASQPLAEEVAGEAIHVEGAAKKILVNAYERDPAARAACLRHFKPLCVVCGMDFGKIYGPEAEGFIHVHHLKPLHEIRKTYRVDPVRHLRPVCPNCHAVIHLGGKTRRIKDVRRMLGNLRP